VAGECLHCGGPNPPRALLCQWCGSALPQPAPPPVQAGPSTVIIRETEPVLGWRRSPGGVIGVVVFIVVVIIIVVAVVSFHPATNPSAPSLNITGLNVISPDNACGLNGDDSGTVDLNPSGGGIPFISWGLPGPSGSLPCTVQSVSTNTPGFSLFGSFPYNATTFPSVLIVSMIAPSSFNGVLNVTFS
jgi:hypothetical protein